MHEDNRSFMREYNGKEESRHDWPIIGGCLMAIGGCIAFYFALRVSSFYSSGGDEGLPTTGFLMVAVLQIALVVLGIASIIGGGAAIQRKSYSMAVMGGVCSTLCSTIFGLVGLILVVRSRVEFADQRDHVKVSTTPKK